MPMLTLRTATAAAAALLALAHTASRAADDDALSLEAPPPAQAGTNTAQPQTADGQRRLYVEAAVGHLQRRGGLPGADSQRVSLDYSQTFRPAPGWRAVLSDRLDDIHPVDSGERATTNSLREAFAGWQSDAGTTLVEFGRIQLRNGPAYGFNPTDYFREGALRAVATADPLALRDNRLGAVMLRAQRLWEGGAISLALAPKLADEPSDKPFSLDLGATNRRQRGLLTWSGKAGDRINWQALGYAEAGRSPQLGVNATVLLSDATVAHGEWSRGREADRLASALGQPADRAIQQRWVAGLTYTAPTRTAITLEYARNGAAPTRAAWDVAAALGPESLGRYLLDAQQRQDNVSRNAWLVYVTQKSLGTKNLDLTGFVRVNADDHSRFAWMELRYHWSRFDTAIQWFRASGNPLSEYGVIPNRQSLQLVGTAYF